MKQFQFPLWMKTHITTLVNDFTVYDAHSNVLFYVKHKMIPVMDDILIYTNRDQQELAYRIEVEGPMLSFSAHWAFYNMDDEFIGKLHHPDVKTNWDGFYEVLNKYEGVEYTIYEDDPYIKVLNGRFRKIPFLGFLSGYVFNPSYSLIDRQGNTILQLKKEPSFWGNRFSLTRFDSSSQFNYELCVLAMFMLLVQESSDG